MTRSKRTRSTKPYGRPRILVVGHSAGEELRKAGADPKFVAVGDPRAIEAAEHENIHGVLLLGGGDVDPRLYGETPDASVYGVSEQRDLIELNVLKAAARRGIPVMGICRGAQLMNVHFGGTLWLDIVRDNEAHGKHRGHDCRVKVVRGSRLAKAVQTPEPWTVHIHHQAVRDVAPGFVPTAFASDGTIEAIESVDGWMLGVQFHPEMDSRPTSQRIFDRFVYAAGQKAGIRVKPEWMTKPMTPAPTPDAALEHQYAPVPRRDEYSRRSGPVKSAYLCGRCGIRFDERADFEDHRVLLHGEARLSVLEGGKS